MDSIGCESLNDGQFDRSEVDRSELESAVAFVLERIDGNLDRFADRFPSPSSDELCYAPTENVGWTSGFWTGMLWLAYAVTGDETYADVAGAQLESYRDRLNRRIDVDCHDVGCIYVPSAVAAYKLTGDDAARELAIDAAETLYKRYHPDPGFLQAWGPMDGSDEWTHGRMIIDSLIVVPLLYWASEMTGDRRYAAAASSHVRLNTASIVREDASTYHTYRFDVDAGEPIAGETHQGYDDESCWARGQAWGIYGYPLAYRHTGTRDHLDVGVRLANYYLNRLPDDLVPRWDFRAPDDDETSDSSAAAIAACGLLELADHLPPLDDRRRRYENAALSTLGSLSRGYTTQGRSSNGVLAAAAYNKPDGDFDECCIWGDYFYFEALVRATRVWDPFW